MHSIQHAKAIRSVLDGELHHHEARPAGFAQTDVLAGASTAIHHQYTRTYNLCSICTNLACGLTVAGELIASLIKYCHWPTKLFDKHPIAVTHEGTDPSACADCNTSSQQSSSCSWNFSNRSLQRQSRNHTLAALGSFAPYAIPRAGIVETGLSAGLKYERCGVRHRDGGV